MLYNLITTELKSWKMSVNFAPIFTWFLIVLFFKTKIIFLSDSTPKSINKEKRNEKIKKKENKCYRRLEIMTKLCLKLCLKYFETTLFHKIFYVYSWTLTALYKLQ